MEFGIFEILQLICGLCLFLYGMNVMGESLKKSAGNKLKIILGNLTSSPLKGFLLGLGVTLIIQSSSATTVMVVGFVNSGTMLLSQAMWVIVGANLGTAITAWLTGLSGIGGSGETVAEWLEWLKPSSWMPVLALIGLLLLMFSKRSKRQEIGCVLLGFAVLMTGMDVMSGSVSGLKSSESFKSLLTLFQNPILGVLVGLVVTAIVQSSSASVGILQSLTTTGAITFGTAIPIIIGQNIGTCVTAMLSSIGANKNGRRAALIHLFFNIAGAFVFMVPFYIVNAFVGFDFLANTIDMWGVAAVHTGFKIYAILLLSPFMKYVEKLAVCVVKDNGEEAETENMLDERLLDTPAVAIGRCEEVACKMAVVACDALNSSIDLLDVYDDKEAQNIRKLENKVDIYEDMLGSYLVKLSTKGPDEKESAEITKLLHIIGDFERISDHAVNFVESAEEIADKKLKFSDEAVKELAILKEAVKETLGLAKNCFLVNNIDIAKQVEPLEEVVDHLCETIKHNHIIRLQKNACSIELGFVLSDLLTNLERVSDHCSNIATCVVEIAHNSLDMHKYKDEAKHGSESFNKIYSEYSNKYFIALGK